MLQQTGIKHLIINELSKNIEGEVYLDEISRILWSTDASMYQVIPTAIVTPKSIQDVITTIKFCSSHNLPIHPRGGGAGLIGACIGTGIVLDFSTHMNEMIELNTLEFWFKSQPGRKLANIQKELATFDLFLPPDPASAEYCALGGNIGTNAGGSHSVKYGLMSDYTLSLKVILSNGEVITTRPYKLKDPEYVKLKSKDTLEAKIYENMEKLCLENKKIIADGYPDVKYNIAGYELRGIITDDVIDLTRIFVGSEGTLATIVEIKMRIKQKPKHTVLISAFFKDAMKMGQATNEALNEGASAVELLDYRGIDIIKSRNPELQDKFPDDLQYMLGIEFDGDSIEEIENKANRVNLLLTETNKLAFKTSIAKTPEEIDQYWEIRKLALPLLGQINDNGRKIVPLIEDAAVPPEKLPEYLESIIETMNKERIPFAMYGHAGKGVIHIRPLINLKNKDDIDSMEIISRASFEKILELNGTMSGEHGDGRVRSPYIKELYSYELYSLFVKIKNLFDPKNIFNPNIKITNQSIIDNLRYGDKYNVANFSKDLLLHFKKAEWENEIEMCNGCSRCTSLLTTVNMCPIYKATKKETASPKAKANSLRAIISGLVDKNTLLNSPVLKELIFNCTACQSCIIDCPAEVNIPKIALEIKAQIVENRSQPMNEYILGSFYNFGKILSPISFISNWFMNTRIIRWMGEKTVGITRHRKQPNFSRISFKSWFEKNYSDKDKSTYTEIQPTRKVAYFIGCSANFVNPQIGKALIRVLEMNNVEVVVPDQKCCGLPMYAYGNVKRGKKYAQFSIDNLMPYIRLGYDILVTCSSCGLSLKQEWNDLLGSEDAQEISRATYHFSEYLLKMKKDGVLIENFKEINLNVAYHTPCHLRVQKSAKYSSLQSLKLIPKLNVSHINQGCCGICGSWGYKRENYDTSMKIGSQLFKELTLDQNQIGVTDCPTCKLQMEHGSDQKILHPIELLAKSYDNDF